MRRIVAKDETLHKPLSKIEIRNVAEGVGFEPTVPLQARRFSRPVP